MFRPSRPRGRHLLLPLFLLAMLQACRDEEPSSLDVDEAPARTIAIEVLSARPDMITGGDALIRIDSAGIDPANLRITLNDVNISAQFSGDRSTNAEGVMQGLISGLIEGENTLVAMDGAGSSRAQLTLVNHPIIGPVISGPHVQPFLCTTEEEGLGEPLDEHCTAETRINYYYRGIDEEFHRIADVTAPYPDDLVSVSTGDGGVVPFVVRVESGTINRAIYHIAVLDDPRSTYGEWNPETSGWNQRLLFGFGGGCGTRYNQGSRSIDSVLDELVLGRGFAHIVSSFNVMGHQCNDNLSAETLMMLKEHFIENYAQPVWTVGSGGSGGAIQQLLITQNYPGLLDGLLPSLSFADSFSLRPDVADCRLLLRYFDTSELDWSEDKQQSVEGYSAGTCEAWDRSLIDVIVADTGCDIPAAMVYHPQSNPSGARCTLYDTNVSSLGRDPQTGFANQALDNIGVQYGLIALSDGTISVDEFLDLNQRIGGYDRDGNPAAARTEAQSAGLAAVYRTGRVNAGGGALGSVPILHYRPYNDARGDIHDRFRDFQIRARITSAQGHADNQVIWIHGGGASSALVRELALDTMTQWLDALAADRNTEASIDRVIRAKPATAVDACWTPQGERIDEPFVFQGAGRCNELYPSHTSPRLAAGAPLANEAIKCALRMPHREDYAVRFDDRQWMRLQDIFPTGVCDYGRPGILQEALAGTWLRLPLE